MSEDFRVSVDDGKYTIVVDDSSKGPVMRFLRYGEPWPAEDRNRRGDTLVLLLALELHEARKELELLRPPFKGAEEQARVYKKAAEFDEVCEILGATNGAGVRNQLCNIQIALQFLGLDLRLSPEDWNVTGEAARAVKKLREVEKDAEADG